MAILWTTLCAVFMLTVITSKPVCLNGCENSSSSESCESKSSEEVATDVGPSQQDLTPAFPEADMPNAVEETDPSGTAALLPPVDSGPSPSTLDTSALPDPQTSTDTDALQQIPDDPALGTDISQDMPESGNTDTVHVLAHTKETLHPGLTHTNIVIGIGGSNQPQVATSTKYQAVPQGVTSPFPPHVMKPTPSFTTPSVPIPVSTAVPVCFTFQFESSERGPPRGDSI
ncbi:mucin-2-like [Mastacembelus armatus]|uniref:mucin-2-like n=1 Tax=Mastacembelus armatus TaxID=205130 RepID=UPI000E453B57|nr:mucin-2-like [Mastacembelus armatus]